MNAILTHLAMATNNFGDGCGDNTFGDTAILTHLAITASSNTFGKLLTIWQCCNSNTFGDGCTSNTFGNNCEF